MGVGVGRGRVIAVPHQCLGVDWLNLGPGKQRRECMPHRSPAPAVAGVFDWMVEESVQLGGINHVGYRHQ